MIQALADVLDLDVDRRVLLLEQVDLILNVGYPGPEGQVGGRVQRFFALRIRDLTVGAARAARGLTVGLPGSLGVQPASANAATAAIEVIATAALRAPCLMIALLSVVLGCKRPRTRGRVARRGR